MTGQKTDFDVAIVGAGPVGLAFAGMLANVWGECANRIALFDAKSLDVSANDPRILALSDATRLRLSALGFPTNAVPIDHIHVSERGAFGQVRMRASEMGLRALGWTVRYGDLVTALSASVEKSGVQIFRPANVKFAHRSPVESLEILELDDGREFTVGLRVDAEGGLYGEAGERDRVVDYGQHALVSEVVAHVDASVLSDGKTVAFERFTQEGPLALLPISENQTRYSLVWCASQTVVNRRLSLAEAEFQDELHQAFGRRVRIEHVGKRMSFPLGMNWRNQLVQGRRVAIGNAAQILHPVAGQGLNLGLRDAATLCRLLSPKVLTNEGSALACLQAYEQARKPDRTAVLRLTDLMVKGFSNSNPLLGAGRQAALNLMEFAPLARKQFADLMLFGLAA